MNKRKCMCGRMIPREQHTGRCLLDHWISYTGDGKHGVDSEELKSIVDIIVQDRINEISKLALAYLLQVEHDRKTHGEISEITFNEVLDFVNDLSKLFKRIAPEESEEAQKQQPTAEGSDKE